MGSALRWPMAGGAAILPTVLALLLTLLLALPGGRDPALHASEVAAARQAERSLDLEAARRRYERALDADPLGQHSAQCARRLGWIEARRGDDGGFAQWTLLEAARRGAAVDVEALLDQGPSAVRVEAAVWLAQRALGDGDPERAVALTEPWIATPTERPQLVRETRLRALVAAGRLAEAETLEGARGAALAPQSHTRRARRVERRRLLRTGAWVWLGLWALVVWRPAARGWRARPPPWGLLPLAALILGGGALAHLWQAGLGTWAWPLLAGCGLIHLGALGADLGASAAARPWLGAGAAGATVACGFLVLEQHRMLAWVGL